MKKQVSALDKEVMIFAAAKMYSLGKDQREVGDRLGVSQPKVSQLLKEAKSKGFLTMRPTLKTENVHPKVVDETERRYFSCAHLQERIHALAPGTMRDAFSVYVFDCTEFDQFCDQAAAILSEILTSWPESLIGVSWGRTLARIIDKMTRLSLVPRGLPSIQCIPICGDPILQTHRGGANFSATVLANQLEYLLTQKEARSPSLFAAPAYLASHLVASPESPRSKSAKISADDGISSVESFVRSIPGWREIFVEGEKGARPLADRLDFTISSLGILQPKERQYDGAFLQERLQSEKQISRDELDKLVLGDFSGLLIPRSEEPSLLKRVNQLNRGWMGIREGHFQGAAERALHRKRNGFHPGNIVITFEPEKVALTRFLIGKGWLNCLIISRRLAEALIAD